ncbi:MAG: COX15/CtaA family protein [Acidimicrobiales bacterium]
MAPVHALAARAGEVGRILRRRRLSPRAFRTLCAVAVGALSLIIVSGAAVRLTGSGLGCPDWPTCAAGDVVAPWKFHAWVEFGNRLVTSALSIVCVLTVGGAFVRSTRRRDLTWLSLGLVGGIAAEIVLGGITVLEKLAPPFVMAHFLLAVVFLADAVVLHHRAGLPEEPVTGRPGRARVTGPAVPLVSREQRWLARLLLVATLVVITLGTVVTSTGPHGGAPGTPRFAFSLHDVAQLHGSAVEVYLVFTVATLWLMARSGAPRSVLRRGSALLAALVVQGAIGYIQYFSGVPAWLVELHVVGATVVVLTVLWFNLALTAHPSPAPGAPGPPLAEAAAGVPGVAVPAGAAGA